MDAAANGEPACIDLLLARGANPFCLNCVGRAPSQIALQHGHLHCHGLLLAAAERVELAQAAPEGPASPPALRI
jgi:ankyrin repeat protein